MSSVNTNICVFCGSRDGSNPVFTKVAFELGERLAESGFGLVYGAGNVGVMGALSDGALSRDGHVTGVIPRDMMEREWGRSDITELEVVASLHERKTKMYAYSSALVMLPGGFGTFEEFFESLTWTQIGHHDKPSFVLNIDGYYDPLMKLIDRARDSMFISQADRDLVTVVNSVDDLMTELKAIS